MNKLRAWSEGRGSSEDATMGLGGLNDNVVDRPVRDGILLQSCQCLNCGYQMQHILDWGEIACFFLNDKPPEHKRADAQGSPISTFYKSGVEVKLQCRHCAKMSPVMCTWPEIEGWVHIGVRERALSRAILQARGR